MGTADKNPKIVAIIPARGGSKGISRKNIKPFNDKPLIHYAIELAKAAQQRGVIFDHIVSTDSEEIASIAKEMKGNVPFLRPAELATDGSAVVDTAIHAVNWWEKNHGDTIHSILILQPTNPLTAEEDIENSVKHYLDNQPDASCLISVCDAQHIRLSSLYHEKGGYLEQVFKDVDPAERRQTLKKLYWRNGAVYITRRDLLLGERRIINENPLFYTMPRERSVAIDDIYDWNVAELFINRAGK
jgi:CMP-N,N'-diacetyllegionaminic acid synthase